MENEEISEQEPEIEEKYEDKFLKHIESELKWPFFKNNLLKAAYIIGAYFERVEYLQRKELNTMGLQKKIRPLISSMDKNKLIKIFNNANEVNFAIKGAKRRDYLSYTRLRQKIEELIVSFENYNEDIDSNEIFLAFMTGYDSGYRFNKKLKKEKE
ncbi:MAG: hypothetical protein ACTSPW_11135 [Promethearchaeota archaeon]